MANKELIAVLIVSSSAVSPTCNGIAANTGLAETRCRPSTRMSLIRKLSAQAKEGSAAAKDKIAKPHLKEVLDFTEVKIFVNVFV